MHNKKKWKQFLNSAVAVAMSSAMAISAMPVNMISAAEITQTETTTEKQKTETNIAKENTAKTITIKSLALGDEFDDGTFNYKVISTLSDTTENAVAIMGYVNSDTNETSLTIPESVTNDGIEYVVTQIGDSTETKGAFEDKSNITSLTMPANAQVKTINDFEGCTSIKDFTITAGKGLKKGIMPDYVSTGVNSTSTYKYTPWVKTSVTDCSLNLSDEITKIGELEFRESKFSEVNMPSSVTTVGSQAFRANKTLEKVIISDNVTSILGYTFYDCTNLKELLIPAGVNVMSGAFITSTTTKNNYISKIEITEGSKTVTAIDNGVNSNVNMPWYKTSVPCSIKIDEGVNKIDDEVFRNSTNIEEVTLSDSINEIGQSTFEGCSTLKSIVIPKNIKKINSDTFFGCKNMSTVDLPEGLETIESQAFTNCKSLHSIELPDSLNKIGDNAFGFVYTNGATIDNTAGLSSIIIPDNVTIMGKNIFQYCTLLNNIKLPSDIQQIPESMCMNCNLTSVDIPDSVNTIGSNAFYGNTNLVSVNFITAEKSSEDLTIGTNAFTNVNNEISTADATLNISKGYKKIKNASGVDINLRAPSLFEGYNFGGWFSDEELEEAVSSDTTTLATDNTIFTKWTLGEYSVIYYPNGGKVDEDEKIDTFTYYDGPIDLPTATKSGYTFAGWFTNKELTDPISTLPYGRAENLNIYAKWIPTTYNILYELDGGNSVNNPSKYSVETSTFFLVDSTRKGYTFEGWYSDSSLTNRITSVPSGLTGDKIFYAKWNLDTYSINYQLNGGSNGYNPSTYNVTSYNINFANPKRSGYIFAGWYRDSACKNRIYNIPTGSVGDMTVYAKWSKVSTGKVSSPKTSSVKKKSFVYKYKKVSGAKGYQITYAKNSKMTKGKKIVYTSSTKKTISKLKRKTTYYVRVRAYKLDSKGRKIYGKYSSKKKVRTK